MVLADPHAAEGGPNPDALQGVPGLCDGRRGEDGVAALTARAEAELALLIVAPTEDGATERHCRCMPTAAVWRTPQQQ